MVINILYILLILGGVVVAIFSIIKDKEYIKEKLSNLKEPKNKDQASFGYVVCDYTFIVSAILLIVMFILTQKTISIL